METRRAFQTSPRRMSIILSGHEKRDYLKFIGFAEIQGANRGFLPESQCGESRLGSHNKEKLRCKTASRAIHQSIATLIRYCIDSAFVKRGRDVQIYSNPYDRE